MSRRSRRQLRKAVADNVSDSYLEAHGPLQWMVAAAREGKQKDVAELAEIFAEHAKKIVEVAHLGRKNEGRNPTSPPYGQTNLTVQTFSTT